MSRRALVLVLAAGLLTGCPARAKRSAPVAVVVAASIDVAHLQLDAAGWELAYDGTTGQLVAMRFLAGPNNATLPVRVTLAERAPPATAREAESLITTDRWLARACGPLWSSVRASGELDQGYWLRGVAKDPRSHKEGPRVFVVRTIGAGRLVAWTDDLQNDATAEDALALVKSAHVPEPPAPR